jgi:hypothetical protein
MAGVTQVNVHLTLAPSLAVSFAIYVCVSDGVAGVNVHLTLAPSLAVSFAIHYKCEFAA